MPPAAMPATAMPPAAMPTTSKTVETATATAKARPPAGGKTPGIATVIKTAEGAGASIWLSVKRG